MHTITNLTELKNLLHQFCRGTVVRVTNRDITAGIGLHELFDPYAIVTVHETAETDLARKIHPIFSLEEVLGSRLKRTHDAKDKDPLLSPEIHAQIAQLPGPDITILPYAISKDAYRIAQEKHWNICALSPEQKRHFDARNTFIQIAKKADVHRPHAVVVHDCGSEDITTFFRAHGACVVQNYYETAGMGTKFIRSEDDILNLKESDLGGPRSISQYVEGGDISCTGCIVGDQIVVSPPRVGIVGCTELTMNKGQFCGHDWNTTLPEETKDRARMYTRRIGQVLQSLGYKGIFGVDMLWNFEDSTVYTIEINPRLLGSSQMYALQQMELQQPPLLGLHVLAFLNVPVTLPQETVEKIETQSLTGAHFIVRNMQDSILAIQGEVQPGIYTVEGNNVQFERSAIHLGEVQKPHEYLVTMVPQIGRVVGQQAQLIRVQTRTQCYDVSTGKLLPAAKLLADTLLASLQLQTQ
jgi:hypothetical protein